MLNYALLVLAFLFLVALCFVPGLVELRWPKDQGPVDIDLDRDIDERYFSRAFKAYLKSGLSSVSAKAIPLSNVENSWLRGVQAKKMRTFIHRGAEDILVIDGDVNLPTGTEWPQAALVQGNLTTSRNCLLLQEVSVEGDCLVGESNHLQCLSAKNISLGENTIIDGWIDAEEKLITGVGCEVHGRATAGKQIRIMGIGNFKSLAAPVIEVISSLADMPSDQDLEEEIEEIESEAPLPLEPVAEASEAIAARPEELEEEIVVPPLEATPEAEARPTDEKLEREVEAMDLTEWPAEYDSVISGSFHLKSIEEIGDELRGREGKYIPYRFILWRANMLGLVNTPLTALKSEQKPEYMRSSAVWLQAPTTIRVKGGLSVPEGETVPYDLIIEGDLDSDTGVFFDGGLHVRGTATLGEVNQIQRSLVADGNVILGEYTTVGHCVNAGGSVFVKTGTRIGVTDTGGLAARETVYLEPGVNVHGKIYGEHGVEVRQADDEIAGIKSTSKGT